MQIGDIYKNSLGLEFIIESKNIQRSNSDNTYYNIHFLQSDYKCVSRSDTIKSGLIRDKLHPSCCNIGKIGYINTRQHNKEYGIWENMLYRCYNPQDSSYKFYGEKGVTVCERWHRFDYFVEDIPKIAGYDETLFYQNKLQLDKDKLSKENKIYSLETTMWVSCLENQKIRAIEHNQKYKKYAIFPDGHHELILHITDFCKQHNLHRQAVVACLQGKQKTSKGFKFYKEQ